ncbi:MAG: molybdopterin-dependent oxidoreductase [Microbacterium sp.]|uniref:molybdopterin-dependent oxidoreductase n=1 Tax=Microbacterium sp. TaxID=51671 RepID=UPI001AC6A65E|nr:molybdopterin-dependent oxidoreductase [Microbacterium sp.]MBN9176572.1 molybdopterin-dependent oxidoreductase [Microbacterium sp.]
MDTDSAAAPAHLGALAGVAAVTLGAGLGELTALAITPSSSPVASIGGALIDAAPAWAKDAAISLFGTNDKAALLTGIAIALFAVACAAGWLELRRPPWGRVAALALGAVGVAAALTRAQASPIWAVPSVVAGVAAALILGALARRARGTARAVSPATPVAGADPDGRGADRRTFLLWSGVATVAGAIALVGGGIVRASSQAASAVRAAVRLPQPVATVAVPAAAELGIPGLAPYVTPNESFYRIDTALVVPQIDPADWRLRIHGLVAHEVTLTWDELLALPLEESVTTLACVSNDVGGDLISNAVWLGYPIRALLARAEPAADADMVLSTSIDGFTASTPLDVLTDDRAAILAVGMNGEPLPAEHGFPVRMVVPGLYGYVSATKWVVDLEVTRFADATAYWTDRGWSPRGPVKLESRIDVPRAGTAVDAGDAVIAGVAWQQHVGVAGVEVQVDDGEWQAATLASAVSGDTWVQWSLPWRATSGIHTLRCRAISATGETQTSTVTGVVPDGATGWHEVRVQVA